jgi:hypothetical protein
MYYFSKITGAGLFCWHGRFVSENTTDGGEMQARLIGNLFLRIAVPIGYFLKTKG